MNTLAFLTAIALSLYAVIRLAKLMHRMEEQHHASLAAEIQHKAEPSYTQGMLWRDALGAFALAFFFLASLFLAFGV